MIGLPSILFNFPFAVIVQFVPSDDPEQEGRKVPSYKILYTKQDPGLEDTVWNEVGPICLLQCFIFSFTDCLERSARR